MKAIWGKFRVDVYPVIPISDSEIKAEATAFTLGEKRDHLEGYVKEFCNNPNKITVKK